MVHQHHPASLIIVVAIAAACGGERVQPARAVAGPTPAPAPRPPPHCPEEMALIGADKDVFCIDRWEASTTTEDGAPHSPYQSVKNKRVRAVSRRDVVPQAYISKDEASAACRLGGKRLCADAEWVRACRGPKGTKYPYGDERRPRACNDSGVQPIARMPESRRALNWENMNDPRLNQMSDTVAKTGSFADCTNGFGVFDMVGNLHEWVEEVSFNGGYFLDVVQHGDGCEYKTTAHESWYHDYSTGFRCCKDAER